MMKSDERQFLLTAMWLFMRHGQPSRARAICEALVEDNPRDGVAVAAFAELLLDEGRAREALNCLRAADFPPSLEHAEAVLETRALKLAGRRAEADSRWRRYLESKKGAERRWIA